MLCPQPLSRAAAPWRAGVGRRRICRHLECVAGVAMAGSGGTVARNALAVGARLSRLFGYTAYAVAPVWHDDPADQMKKPLQQRGVAIPSGRLNRLARLGGMTASVAANIAWNSGKEVLSGKSPNLRDLLLTPGNATRVAEQLARMRGAAMKAGQLLSMETQGLLPPDLAEILGRLRSEAHFMPLTQLKQVLIANWGRDFAKRFAHFDVQPIAAASIGQVHRAQTVCGRDVAVKVQYPGVRESIDSDIRNLGMLLRSSGMIPASFDLSRLLEDARVQLHEETDYRQEALAQKQFAALLADTAGCIVPRVHDDLTTDTILAMDYVQGIPIEEVASLDQTTRDWIASRLISLLLQELFVHHHMQTDPNFANYRYDRHRDCVILLDFGATRRFDPAMVAACKALLRSSKSGSQNGAMEQLVKLGIIGTNLPEHDRALLVKLFEVASEPLRCGGIFDFGNSDLLVRLRRAGLTMVDEQVALHAPLTEVLLLQRKILGCYLLAEYLAARVDIDALLEPFL